MRRGAPLFVYPTVPATTGVAPCQPRASWCSVRAWPARAARRPDRIARRAGRPGRRRRAAARWRGLARHCWSSGGRGRLFRGARSGSRRCGESRPNVAAHHARHDARRSARQLRLRRGSDAEPRSAGRAGVRFARLSPAPLTLPAHASLMTGRHPYTHGVRNNGHFVLAADVPTLAELFAAAGYDTAAFVSSFVLDRQFGLARGFARYDDALDQAPAGRPTSLELERRGDRTLAAAAAWLREPGRGGAAPVFLWVHLYDAAPALRRRHRRSASSSPAVPTTARSRSRTRWSARCWRARGTARPSRRSSSWPATTARAWASTAKARTACSSTRVRCACR